MAWLERQPLRILDWNIKERQNGRRDRPKIAIECEDLPGYLSPNVLVRVAIVDPEIPLEQVHHGQIGHRLAVGH